MRTLTDKQYIDNQRCITLIKQGHTLLPSPILNQAINLYRELTNISICGQCVQEIETMLIFLRREIYNYELNKIINV